MASRNSKTCDICGVERMESNHWFLAFVDVSDKPSIAFYPWNDTAAEGVTVKHLCGPGCAAKALSTTMGEWR